MVGDSRPCDDSNQTLTQIVEELKSGLGKIFHLRNKV